MRDIANVYCILEKEKKNINNKKATAIKVISSKTRETHIPLYTPLFAHQMLDKKREIGNYAGAKLICAQYFAQVLADTVI